jgi:hypothetical protein
MYQPDGTDISETVHGQRFPAKFLYRVCEIRAPPSRNFDQYRVVKETIRIALSGVTIANFLLAPGGERDALMSF